MAKKKKATKSITAVPEEVPAAPAVFSGFCPVEPKPKERPRFNSRQMRTYTPARTEKYEGAVREWMREAYGFPRMPMDGPIAAEYEFVLPRPSNTPKKRFFSHTKPDIDNFEKSFQDALDFKVKLNGELALGVLANDSRVASISAVKRYAAEGEQPGTKFSFRSCDAELLLVSDHADEDRLAVMAKGIRRMTFSELAGMRKTDVDMVRVAYVMFSDEDAEAERALLSLAEEKMKNVERVVLV